MTQVLDELVGTLEKAKGQMMDSSQSIGLAGQWDRAQWMFQKAKELDDMIVSLRQNGTPVPTPPPALRPMHSTYMPKPRPEKLPYFFVEGNRLVKIGPSRDGTTYQHRVTMQNFDLIIAKVIELAGSSHTFETPDVVNSLDIPKHEPLIVLAVLEERKLIINIRRGRWVFANGNTFANEVKAVWSALPRS